MIQVPPALSLCVCKTPKLCINSYSNGASFTWKENTILEETLIPVFTWHLFRYALFLLFFCPRHNVNSRIVDELYSYKSTHFLLKCMNDLSSTVVCEEQQRLAYPCSGSVLTDPVTAWQVE